MNFYIYFYLSQLDYCKCKCNVRVHILRHMHACYNKIDNRYVNWPTEYVINNRTVRPYLGLKFSI